MPQFSKPIRNLLSRAMVFPQRDDAGPLSDGVLFVLRCNRLMTCCCIQSACSPGGVLCGRIARRSAAMLGSRPSTAWPSASAMFVGGRDVLDDAVFVCGAVAVQQSGAVTSEHFVRSVALMLRVMTALALIIRLPSVEPREAGGR